MHALKESYKHAMWDGPRVFDIGTKMLPLQRWDMGYGMTLFHLIRESFDELRFRRCLEINKDKGLSGLVSAREVRLFNNDIRKLRPHLSRSKIAEIGNSFGTLQGEDAAIHVARSSDGDIWVAVYGGCPVISALVTANAYQHSLEDYIMKLQQVSELGARSRALYASRIFELYYGTGRIDEVSYGAHVTPYNHVANGKIAIKTAMPAPSQEFAVYVNRQILLLKNNAASFMSVPEHAFVNRMNRQQEPFHKRRCAEAVVLQRLQPFLHLG